MPVMNGVISCIFCTTIRDQTKAKHEMSSKSSKIDNMAQIRDQYEFKDYIPRREARGVIKWEKVTTNQSSAAAIEHRKRERSLKAGQSEAGAQLQTITSTSRHTTVAAKGKAQDVGRDSDVAVRVTASSLTSKFVTCNNAQDLSMHKVEDIQSRGESLREQWKFWATEYAHRTPQYEALPEVERQLTSEVMADILDGWGLGTEFIACESHSFREPCHCRLTVNTAEVKETSEIAGLPIDLSDVSEAEALRVRAAVFRALLDRANSRILDLTIVARAYEREVELVERRAFMMLPRDAK